MIYCNKQSEDSFVCFLLTTYRTQNHRQKKMWNLGKITN